MNIKSQVGKRIKELRVKNDISQEQLALLASIDRTYIASVENGHRNISIVNIQKISKALGISLKEFFNHKDFK